MKKILSLIITTFVAISSFAFNDLDNRLYNYELGRSLLLDSVYSDYINSSNHKVAELILDDNISSEEIDFFIIVNDFEDISYVLPSNNDKYSKRLKKYGSKYDEEYMEHYSCPSVIIKEKCTPFGLDRYNKIREINNKIEYKLDGIMHIDAELLQHYKTNKKRLKLERLITYRIFSKLFQ